MREISKEYVKLNNLKRLGSLTSNDMSKVILMIERLKENKRIKYYTVDLILFNQYAHEGVINVSFWGEISKNKDNIFKE